MNYLDCDTSPDSSLDCDLKCATDVPARLYLDGVWELAFESEGKVTDFPVPSVWTHASPWAGDSSWAGHQAAWLKRWISFPPSWKGQRVRIHFGGVLARCQVFWNRQLVGSHVGGFTPFEFDLGEAGDGCLVVYVQGCAAAYDGAALLQSISYPLNCEEGPLPAGIWQPVWLERIPQTEITGIWPFWDSSAGRWKMTVRHRGGSEWRFLRLSCYIAGEVEPFKNLSAFLRSEEETLDLGDWETVPLWSPEQPQCVQVVWELGDGNRFIHGGQFQTGFRAVEIKGEHLFLNRQPVRLRGFSMVRHRIAPWLWREDYLALYLQTMKNLGFNAVRTHGAITPEVVLRVADRVGLLVENQSSFWSMGWSAYLAGGEPLWQNTEREFRAWFLRDRSHPSVVLWDVENEIYRISPEGEAFSRRLVALARRLDPCIPVVASGSSAADYPDIYHQHCVQGLNKLIEQWKSHRPVKPFIAGEWWPDQTLWGKRTLLFSGLRSSDRWPREFRSRDEVLYQIGMIYAKEILHHRLLGATGTFPFAISTVLFEPLFAPATQLQMTRDRAGGPTFPHVGQGDEKGIHQVRRPFVNPEWNSDKPPVHFSPAVDEVRKALQPVVAGFLETFRQAWSGETVNLHLVIVNDNSIPLKGMANLALGASVSTLGEVEIPAGDRVEIPVSLQFPEVCCETQIHPQLEIVSAGPSATWILEPWLIYPQLATLRPMDIWVSGVSEKFARDLRSLVPFPFIVSSNAPPRGRSAWIIGSDCEPSPEEVSNFLADGGHLLCLRRTEPLPWLPDVLRWVGSQRCLPHSLEGWRLENPDRALQGLSLLEVAHRPLAEEFGLQSRWIGPWRAGDGRIADDLLRRAKVDVDPTYRFPRIVISGPDAEDLALGTIQWGAGEMTFCQLFLEENMLCEPQAAIILQSWLRRVRNRQQTFSSSPSPQAVMVSSISTPSSYPATRPLHLLLWPNPQPPSDEDLLPYEELLTQNGDLVCILPPVQQTENFRNYSAKELVISMPEPSALLEGLNFSLFQEFNPAVFMLPCLPEIWRREVSIFRYDERSPFGGVEPQERLGELWVSRPCLGGRVHLTSLPLDQEQLKPVRFLRAAFLAHAGVQVVPLQSLSTRLVAPVLIRRSPEIPLDGDVQKWVNEEADHNLAPWSRAEPVLLYPKDKEQDGCVVAYLLASQNALHLLLLHRGGNLRSCRPGEAAYEAAHLQITAWSRTLFIAPTNNQSHALFLNGSTLITNSRKTALQTAFFRLSNAPVFPDSSLLKACARQPSASTNVWQLRLTWEGLGHRPESGQHSPLALRFSAVEENGLRISYAWPPDANPKDSSTWGRSLLE